MDARESEAPSINRRHPGVALVLQGGGARAAYQVGVLKGVCHALGNPTSNPFPIITGTSAGAINAAVIASHADDFTKAVRILESVWDHFTPEQVYRTDLLGVAACSGKWLAAFLFGALMRNHKVSLFDNSPLQKLLERYVDTHGISAHIASGALKAVAVTASGYTSGQNCAFFQASEEIKGWKRAQRVGIRVAQLKSDHLMASSAIPFAFPAVKLNREFFGDGSIRQTAPVSPALHLGATRVFVIGTAKLVKDMPTRQRGESYPSLAQIAGHAMSSIFLDSLATDIEVLQRVNSTIALLDTEKLSATGVPVHHVDVCVACPNAPLEELAHQHVGNLPLTIRFLMRSIGAMRKGGAALASYLLFDQRYCRALIEMGYADTMARADEIARFFDASAKPAAVEISPPKFDPSASMQIAAFEPGTLPPRTPMQE